MKNKNTLSKKEVLARLGITEKQLQAEIEEILQQSDDEFTSSLSSKEKQLIKQVSLSIKSPSDILAATRRMNMVNHIP